MSAPIRQLTEENKADIIDRLTYDPDTGLFFHRIDKKGHGGRIKAGTPVSLSTNRSGYYVIGVRGVVYLAHRLAWFLTYGEWPSLQIDHIDHNRTNNRIANLRLVDQRGNKMNESLRKDNTSGITGVMMDKKTGKWIAYYYRNSKMHVIGRFTDKQEAAAARSSANTNEGFHPNHGKPKHKEVA